MGDKRYDEKCEDLAIAFLSDYPDWCNDFTEKREEQLRELATAIQVTIESKLDEFGYRD